MDIEQDEDNTIYSITRKIYTQIVKEEDEYTMNIIEDYVKTKEHSGEFVAAKIIPEGKLRHILNLGLTIFNKEINGNLLETELFKQEEYIEFLRREIHKYQEENQKLKNQIRIMEDVSGLRSTNTIINDIPNE